MMNGMPLETCSAFNKLWNDKFYYKVASCWLFLLIHTTMHGSMNIIFVLRHIKHWRGRYVASKRRDPTTQRTPSCSRRLKLPHLCKITLPTGRGTRWRSWWRLVIDGKSPGFFIRLILPTALWPWSRPSHWRKWVPGISLGGWKRPVPKAGKFATFMHGLCRNSGTLNLLEP
jgi:hypothetical protein